MFLKELKGGVPLIEWLSLTWIFFNFCPYPLGTGETGLKLRMFESEYFRKCLLLNVRIFESAYFRKYIFLERPIFESAYFFEMTYLWSPRSAQRLLGVTR